MKKLVFMFVMTVAAIGFTSCEGPQGPIGPRGPQGPQGPQGESGSVNMKVYTYRVNHDDWAPLVSQGSGDTQCYYYDIVDEDMNVYFNQQGVIMVYRYNDTYTQKPLPDETYCLTTDDQWHEQFDFDIYEPADGELGSVRIYWTVDDYRYENAPDTQVFRVVLMWP